MKEVDQQYAPLFKKLDENQKQRIKLPPLQSKFVNKGKNKKKIDPSQQKIDM